jgi:hypothetical protein
VKDAQGDSAYGRTNWRRFAVAVGVPTVIAGGLVIGLAQGAFAASFAISGQTFKISADKLDGTGFAQYGDFQQTKAGTNTPVAMSGIKTAKLTKLCQSVLVPGTKLSLTIRAGDDPNNPAVATDMLIGMSDLSGEATFTNINIGQDASTLTKGGAAAKGHETFFGQEADGVIINGLHQTAYSTTAGTFKLTGLRLNVNLPDKNGNAVECY